MRIHRKRASHRRRLYSPCAEDPAGSQVASILTSDGSPRQDDEPADPFEEGTQAAARAAARIRDRTPPAGRSTYEKSSS